MVSLLLTVLSASSQRCRSWGFGRCNFFRPSRWICSYPVCHLRKSPTGQDIKRTIFLYKEAGAKTGESVQYLALSIRLPTSALSLRPLRSMDRRELFVHRTRTSMAMSRSFSVIGPSLWNRLPPSARASLLSSNLSTSLGLSPLKTCLFSCI